MSFGNTALERAELPGLTVNIRRRVALWGRAWRARDFASKLGTNA